MTAGRPSPLLFLCCLAGCGATPASPGAAPPAVVGAAGAAGALQASVAASSAAGQTAPLPGVPVNDAMRDMMMEMQMTFFFGNKFSLWFKGFDVSSGGELAAACIGLVILAALYEGLKVYRILAVENWSPRGLYSGGHWLQAVLHMVQITVSYFLMLAVMTYNVWVLLAVCLGAGLGYATFSMLVPAKSLLGATSEHCH
ncbi:high affinity copper uptake protein 1-like [Pollicipes pollicipes]|uniref:high affinity copper uptake protein 1-like n=1 Tax=Pollicipes pollicipes TaxID=41117 RepID=UPI001885466A|nr:high affinity copper uptake protein 1-like [Pollicipes pollicipes]